MQIITERICALKLPSIPRIEDGVTEKKLKYKVTFIDANNNEYNSSYSNGFFTSTRGLSLEGKVNKIIHK